MGTPGQTGRSGRPSDPSSDGSGGTPDRLLAELAGPVEALGLDLEAVDVTVAGRRRLLRVAVDKDGGVSMDDVAAATREVSRTLDEGDLMGERAYTLEVSSPGVDRPLTLPRHWRRNAGRLVKVTRAGDAPVTGRVTSSDDEPEGGVDLEVSGQQVRVAYADVQRALVQIEFAKES